MCGQNNILVLKQRKNKQPILENSELSS
jgi:hypothetical protein